MIEFVAVDIETANPDPTSICEIALVKISGDLGSGQVFNTLIRPEGDLSVHPYNFLVHGLREEDLIDEPALNSIWDQIVDFVGELPLVAHNATQDLNKIFKTIRPDAPSLRSTEFFCTLTIARAMDEILSEDGFTLETVAELVGADWGKSDRASGVIGHSAALDAIATADTFLRMLSIRKTDITGLMEQLQYRPGQIKANQVVRGNTKIKAKTDFNLFKKLGPEEFAGICEALDAQGISRLESHEFSGKAFVLTLLPEDLNELEFWTAVALAGGNFHPSVTAKVDYLVEGYDPTQKYETGQTGKSKKARDLQAKGSAIQILNEEEFLNRLGTELYELARTLHKED